MALLANVALTNTFDTWRTRTNQLVTRINQFAIDESKLYANTITANVRFVSAGSTRLGTTGSNRTIINGLLSANGNLNVAGNTTISGILNVNGGINLGDATTDLLTITGRASVGTNLTVSGNTTIGASGKVANVTGWFGVLGRQSISTNLFVGGNVEIRSASSRVFLPAAGSATNPSLTFFGDPDTGISRVAANSLELEAGGVAVVNIVPASVTITGALAVTGNTTLNGTTTDKSDALNQTLTDGATINWDVALGRVATVTLGGNRTVAAATNQKVGTYILRVVQDGTGGRTLTWNGNFKWTAQTAPVLSTAIGAVDIFTFFSDGSKMYGSFLPDVR